MKKLPWIIFLLLLFLLSYIRETLFISVNAYIDGYNYNYANTELPTFLKDFTKSQLEKGKWMLTAVFSIIFMLTTYFGILLSMKRAKWWVVFVYTTIVVIAGILAVGIFLTNFGTIYPFLRILVGIIHSPLIYIIISISYYSLNVLKKT